MLVKELREKLELIDGECEVLVINDQYEPIGIDKVELNPLFESDTENGQLPCCIFTN